MTIMVMEKVRACSTSQRCCSTILAGSAFVLAGAVVGAWLRRKRPLTQTPAEAMGRAGDRGHGGVWIVAFALAAVGLAPMARDFSQACSSPSRTPLVLTALGVALLGRC
jgi:hypothetical protein